MDIRQFFWSYIDLWVESNKSSDPSTNDQCVDLWRVFNRKVIQAPDIFGNPPDIWEKYQADFYDRIPNTPDGVPQLGDTIIWGTKYSKYGHIAICTEIADTKTFTSFDQNDPVNEPCHFQPHTYAGVLGWLRPKNQSVLEPQEEHPADAVNEGQQAAIEQYQNNISDLNDLIGLPAGNKDFALIKQKVAEYKTLASQDEDFVKKVAEGIGCPGGTKTAVLETLVTLHDNLEAIKTQRLESFGAFERIASGLSALLRRK